MNIIILLGPPASGKGTTAQILSEKYSIPTITISDLIKTRIKNHPEFKKLMDSGKLIDDEVVIKLIKERIKESDCENGFILDGYPRTHNQSKRLYEFLPADVPITSIFLNCETQVIIDRICYRFVCSKCGTIHNKQSLELAEQNKQGEFLCIKCRNSMQRRVDDNPQIMNKRLEVYYRDAELIKIWFISQPRFKILELNTTTTTVDSLRNYFEKNN